MPRLLMYTIQLKILREILSGMGNRKFSKSLYYSSIDSHS